MGVRLKRLADQVMVITGASSGIGLATARMAARRGAAVVLNARNGGALEEIAADLRAGGARALAVAGDVGRRDDVERLADETVRKFGRIDTWVNNAGTSIFGKLEEVSDGDSRALWETNFWGLVYGSLVAVRHLKASGGALINLGSVASDVTIPMQSMYSATKHAIKGFTDGLRMELEQERAPVSVTLIKPASIDTPFPTQARNYMDVEPKLPEPVYAPEDVAEAICAAAVEGGRDVYVGTAGPGMTATHTVAPSLMDWVGETVMGPRQRTSRPNRNPAGTLHRPGPGGRARGDAGARPSGRSSGLATAVALGLAGIGLAVALSGGER